MSHLKNFSDLVGGIGAFFATVFIFGKYMEYNPAVIDEGESKLEWFFSSKNASEYRQYLVLIGLAALTIAVGLIFKKRPEISLVASVLPLTQAMSMLYKGLFYEFAHFYVAICAVMFFGSLYEVVVFDKAHGTNRTALGTSIVGGLSAVLTYLAVVANDAAIKYGEISLSEEGLSEAQAKLVGNVKSFGILLLSDVPEKEKDVLTFLVAVFIVCVILHVLLRRIYFINAILAFVPFACSVSALHAEKIAIAPMLVIVPATLYLVCCLVLNFSGGREEDKQEQEVEKETE